MKKTKGISSKGQLKKTELPALTSKMIVALLAVIESESVTDSLTELVNRGLIVRKQITLNNHKEFQWCITAKGIITLNRM